jgi:hypothetical protein
MHELYTDQSETRRRNKGRGQERLCILLAESGPLRCIAVLESETRAIWQQGTRGLYLYYTRGKRESYLWAHGVRFGAMVEAYQCMPIKSDRRRATYHFQRQRKIHKDRDLLKQYIELRIVRVGADSGHGLA